MPNLPTPQSLFLADIATGLRKRSKALKHAGGSLSCERLVEKYSDDDVEKLEIRYGPATGRRASVWGNLWDDRWCAVGASLGSKDGWIWTWNTKGRLIGTDIGREFVVAFERTYSLTGSMTSERVQEFDSVWHPILKTGELRPV